MPDDTPANTPDQNTADGGASEKSAAEALAAEALAAAEQAVAGIRSDDVSGRAQQAIAAAQRAVSGMSGGSGARRVQIPSFEGGRTGSAAAAAVDLLSDVNLSVKIELGRTRMYLEDVLRLSNGSVVELDKLAGDPVDIYVNERHVARGEVLILNDNFCVRINEIIAGVGAAKAG